VEYLLVNTEGRVLAVLRSLREAALALAWVRRNLEAIGPVRVERHDVHDRGRMGVDSFVSASLLPSLPDRSSQKRERFARRDAKRLRRRTSVT
jgi:hypothetical protein